MIFLCEQSSCCVFSLEELPASAGESRLVGLVIICHHPQLTERHADSFEGSRAEVSKANIGHYFQILKDVTTKVLIQGIEYLIVMKQDSQGKKNTMVD